VSRNRRNKKESKQRNRTKCSPAFSSGTEEREREREREEGRGEASETGAEHSPIAGHRLAARLPEEKSNPQIPRLENPLGIRR